MLPPPATTSNGTARPAQLRLNRGWWQIPVFFVGVLHGGLADDWAPTLLMSICLGPAPELVAKSWMRSRRAC
jgi:hypothetical protein